MSSTVVVFETHSLSEDNELGCASGWNHGGLSPRGRQLAAELGQRRRPDDLDAVLVSDLRRATETAEIAFAGSPVPVLHDWRLRECNYGDLNGQPADRVRAAAPTAFDRYPGGESWVDAIERVRRVLEDIQRQWRGGRVLIIGHMSAYWALEHHLNHLPIESIGVHFDWQEGWEYELPT